jgi:hypothetical protein
MKRRRSQAKRLVVESFGFDTCMATEDKRRREEEAERRG